MARESSWAVATLGAWCEPRRDFRNLRLDRIETLEVLDRTHANEPGRSLQDYFRFVSESYDDNDLT